MVSSGEGVAEGRRDRTDQVGLERRVWIREREGLDILAVWLGWLGWSMVQGMLLFVFWLVGSCWEAWGWS